jgi:hypothetical protein
VNTRAFRQIKVKDANGNTKSSAERCVLLRERQGQQ